MGAGRQKRHQPFKLASPTPTSVHDFNQRHGGRIEITPSDDWDPEALEAIIRELDRLLVEFPLDHPPEKVTDVRTVPGAGPDVMGAAWAGRRRRQPDGTWVIDDTDRPLFAIHPRALDPDTATNAKRAGWWSTGDVLATVRHEYGHHVHYQAEFRMALERGIKDDTFSRDRDSLAPLLTSALGMPPNTSINQTLSKCKVDISGYARSNPAEAFAEAFAEYSANPVTCRPTSHRVATALLAVAFNERTKP